MYEDRNIYFTQKEAHLTVSCLVDALAKGMEQDYWSLNAPAASAAAKLMAKASCREFSVKLGGAEILSIRNALKAFAPGRHPGQDKFDTMADEFETENGARLSAFAFEMAGYTAPLQR